MSSPNTPGGTDRSLSGISPSKTPEARRLRRFTTDPRYGPKLKHLPQREQRRILDLVTGNRGRQARQELLTADTARKEARNARERRARRSKAENSAISNLTKRLPEARRSSLERHMEQMTYRDLKFAREATREELQEAARSGKRTITINGEEVNLFWYH